MLWEHDRLKVLCIVLCYKINGNGNICAFVFAKNCALLLTEYNFIALDTPKTSLILTRLLILKQTINFLLESKFYVELPTFCIAKTACKAFGIDNYNDLLKLELLKRWVFLKIGEAKYIEDMYSKEYLYFNRLSTFRKTEKDNSGRLDPKEANLTNIQIKTFDLKLPEKTIKLNEIVKDFSAQFNSFPTKIPNNVCSLWNLFKLD